MTTFRSLHERWTRMQNDTADEEGGLSLQALLRPFVVRLGVLLLTAAVLGAAAYRLAVPRRWPRALLDAFTAATVGFLLEAGLELPAGLAAIVGPALLFGAPAALYCLLFPARTRRCVTGGVSASRPGRLRLAAAVLFAWTLATLPLVVLMTPHF